MKQNTNECRFCGRTFVSMRSDAQYCCNSHRQLAYYLRDRNRHSRSNSSALSATASEENMQLAEIKKLSARFDAIKANLETQKKKQANDAVGIFESMVSTLQEASKNKNLDKVKSDTLKIVETLFEQDACGE